MTDETSGPASTTNRKDGSLAAKIAEIEVKDAPSSPSCTARSESRHGSLHGASSPQLGPKAARLVEEGLPWPEEEQLAHETKKLVTKANVPWIEDQVSCIRTRLDLCCTRPAMVRGELCIQMNI
jgi:hypothetical protein